MNIISTLRKPCIVYFLASLMLIISCNQDQALMLSHSTSMSIDEYACKQVALGKEVLTFLSLEKNINYEMLKNFSSDISSYEDLEEHYRRSGVENSYELILLTKQAQENIQNLLKSNKELHLLHQEEINQILSEKIISIYNSSFLRNNNCQSQYQSAQDSCGQSWAISMTAVGVAGWVVGFGVGFLIGTAAAYTNLTICLNNARDDFDECKEQQQE